MRPLLLELFVAIGLTIGSLLSLTMPANASGVTVEQVFARASASPAATSGVIYFVLRNGEAEGDRLIGLATARADAAELHASVAKGDSMTMEPVAAVVIPGGGAVHLSPGGLHVMLFGLSAPLKEGESFALTLTFEKAGQVTVDVPVLGVAAAGP